MADIDEVLKLTPGKKKLNLHASYAIFEDGKFVDRDKIEPKHFAKWVEFAKERGLEPLAELILLQMTKEPVEKLARRAAEMSVALAKGEPLDVQGRMDDGTYEVPYECLEPEAVTRENMDEVITGKYHEESDIYLNVRKQGR